MLPTLDLVIDPVLQARIVDVLHAARAFAQAHQRVIAVVGRVEADPALVLGGVVAFPRHAFHLPHLLQVHTLRLEVLLRQLLLLLHHFLQLQLHLAYLHEDAHLERVFLALAEDPPQRLLVAGAALQVEAVAIEAYGVEGGLRGWFGLVDEVLAVVDDVGVGSDDLVGDDAVIRRVKVK